MKVSKNQYAVIFSTAIVFAFSFLGLRNVSFDILPEFQAKTVQVQTEALGLSASEVEDLVTINVEEMLTNTPWMEKMESTSVNGLSSVKITFAPDTDIMEARQMVSENIALSQLIPNVSQKSVIIQPQSTTNRVMAIGLSSESLSLIDISQLSRWNIRPALLSVPGVSNVSIWGHRERQLQVQVDQDKINNTRITLDDVIEATGNTFWMSELTYLEASTPGAGGWIDTPNQRLEIQHILPIRNEEDLAQIPFSRASYLDLGDVSSVVEGHQPLIGDAVLGNEGGILLVIEKYPQSSVLDVTSGVENKLLELKAGLPGIDIDTEVFRPATFVESAINNLSYVFLASFILFIVGLMILFRNTYIALIASSSIFVSLVIILFALHSYGLTISTVLFAGVVASLGIIIDQVISGLERGHRENIQVTLITILLMVPVLFLNNNIKLFYEPLVISYIISIIIGMIFAMFIFPIIVKFFSSKISIKKPDHLFIGRLKNICFNGSKKILKTSPAVSFAIAIFAVVSYYFLFFGANDMLPDYMERTIVVDIENTPGTSLTEMNRVVKEIGDKVQLVDGVNNFGADIGRSISGDQIIGVNSAQLWISFNKDVDYATTKGNITESLDDYSEIIKNIGTYSQKIMDRHLVSNEDEIFVRVYGAELEELKKQAEKVKSNISRVSGIISPEVIAESQTLVPGIKIEVNTDIASRYGLKPGDVRRAAATIVNGLQVANRFEEQKIYQVAVWSLPEERRNVEDIKNILIDTSYGGKVPLSVVADVNIVPIISRVDRESASRYVDVVFEVRGDKDVVIENLEKNLHDMELTLEYHATIMGDYAENNNNNLSLIIVMVIIGIIFLLQSIFNSWRLAILIFITALSTLIGGVLVSYLLNESISSLSTLLGLLVVFSIAIRNMVMTIIHYKNLEETGLDGDPLVISVIRDRLTQTLTTTMLIILVFVPVLVAGNIPGLELIRPMAMVIIGGLITLLFVKIYFLPKLYFWNDIKNNDSYEI